MLKHRIITAAILAPLALALVFFTPLSLFTVIAAALTLLGAWEWSALMGLQKPVARGIYVAVMAAVLLLLHISYPITSLWQQGHLAADAKAVFVLAAMWWLWATILVWIYPKAKEFWYQSKGFTAIAGGLTLVPMWLGLNALRAAHYEQSSTFGSWLIVVVLGIVWAADIGAYFVGKQFGKHKLMPKVSPNKTIEGLSGGMVTAALFAALFYVLSDATQLNVYWCALLAALLAFASAMGDLLESMFKREAGLKDSGNLLPGHGGILDRIDSLTAAVPLFVLCWLALGA